jgi:hypothetical protein
MPSLIEHGGPGVIGEERWGEIRENSWTMASRNAFRNVWETLGA